MFNVYDLVSIVPLTEVHAIDVIEMSFFLPQFSSLMSHRIYVCLSFFGLYL